MKVKPQTINRKMPKQVMLKGELRRLPSMSVQETSARVWGPLKGC